MKWRMSPLLRVVMTCQTNEISGLLWRAAERINSRRPWWYFSKKRKQGWNAWGMMGNGSWRVSARGGGDTTPCLRDRQFESITQPGYIMNIIIWLYVWNGLAVVADWYNPNQIFMSRTLHNIVSVVKSMNHCTFYSKILVFYPIILYLTT